jgi:hypothetical protein
VNSSGSKSDELEHDCTELLLGMRGKLDGETFELTGRAHVVSRGGGHWNEWRAKFADGREGWLAEAATRFYFMFEAPLVEVEPAVCGATVSARYVVSERDEAERVASFGDAAPPDGTSYRYVDLSGDDGKAATVDYGDGLARSFIGRRVTLEELGLLAAREPTYLHVEEGEKPDSRFEVGTDISVQNAHYKIIASLVRSAPDDDERFVWEEHLLYRQGSGLVWLVELPDEYRLVTPVEAGAVEVRDGSVRFGGESWKKLRTGLARTDGVRGSLPWRARVGEEVTATDYAKKDRVLSVEQTAREVVWSVSVPLDESELVYAPPRTSSTSVNDL